MGARRAVLKAITTPRRPVNSQSAKQWRKAGSLVVEIENMQDGDGATITANRTVVLGFTPSGRVRVLKSTIQFTTEKP